RGTLVAPRGRGGARRLHSRRSATTTAVPRSRSPTPLGHRGAAVAGGTIDARATIARTTHRAGNTVNAPGSRHATVARGNCHAASGTPRVIAGTRPVARRAELGRTAGPLRLRTARRTRADGRLGGRRSTGPGSRPGSRGRSPGTADRPDFRPLLVIIGTRRGSRLGSSTRPGGLWPVVVGRGRRLA